jgi:hypothetical protein
MELRRYYVPASDFRLTDDSIESCTSSFFIRKDHIVNVVNISPEGEYSGLLAVQTNERLLLFSYLDDEALGFEELWSSLALKPEVSEET